MIGYAMLGTNDMPRALAFYDQVLAVIGASRVFGDDRAQAYGIGAPSFAICRPYDGQPATPGNGTMIALAAADRAAVDATHAKALAAGATDEGAPGPRGGENSDFYAAYFRDPDGNKLCVFKSGG